MATMRELKNRIGSVNSSEKITGAMKMISSAKLQKAETALSQSRPYREQLRVTLSNLLSGGRDYSSPLTEIRQVKQRAIVIFGSDEGLCGSFNLIAYKKLLSVMASDKSSSSIQVYVVGQKMEHILSRNEKINLVREWSPNPKKNADDIHGLAQLLIRRFETHSLDRIDIIYSRFKSIGTQILTQDQLLPIKPSADIKEETTFQPDYIYEPDKESIFQTVLPLYVKASLYEYWLENRTSEQAARILAMQLAHDNATKLLDNLNLEYNKLRQQGITAELLDILGGSAQ